MTASPHQTDSDRSQAGLTLVELMVALVIVSIAVAAVFAFGWSVMNAYRDQQTATETSRAARGSLDFLSHVIRGGSPAVPTGNIYDAVGCDANFRGVMVADDPEGNGRDELRVAYASGGVYTTLRQDFVPGDTILNVFDASDFRAGDLVVVADVITNSGLGMIAQLIGSEIVGAPNDLEDDRLTFATTCPPPSEGLPQGSLVVRAQIARFFVDPDRPALYMEQSVPPGVEPTPEPLAIGIEDMQIAVGVDSNDDGILEAGEWHYSAANTAPPPDLAVRPWDALRVTLVARSVSEASTAALSAPLLLENHDPGAEADEFRRRAVHAVIQLRNVRSP